MNVNSGSILPAFRRHVTVLICGIYLSAFNFDCFKKSRVHLRVTKDSFPGSKAAGV
jgi:hypothetical protein